MLIYKPDTKILSYWLNVHIRTKAPRFLKRYKYIYGGERFAVYRRVFKNAEEDITIFRTSDKCYRLLRTSNLVGQCADIWYQSFRSIASLCEYLDFITP